MVGYHKPKTNNPFFKVIENARPGTDHSGVIMISIKSPMNFIVPKKKKIFSKYPDWQKLDTLTWEVFNVTHSLSYPQ